MLVATAAAITWATLAAESYESVRTTTFGPSSLHLHLDVATWAADGLLTVFFFVAGLELRRELTSGNLRRPAEAVLPIVAATCGMVVPALVYTAVNVGGDLRGWAVPTATDIAFALAVLAVIGTQLPSALRAFLLTLAVVDDLLAIVLIAVVFTSDLQAVPLLIAAGLVVAYGILQSRGLRAWWLYLPMGLVAWALVHESGVHATIVGISFGLLTRAVRRPGEDGPPSERVEHLVQPFSAAVCVPLFALFAAGIELSADRLHDVFTDPVPLGIVLGLVVGKTAGVFGGTYLAARITSAELNEELAWGDVFGISLLAGMGFTVSLLIGQLAFDGEPETIELVKIAVLVGSVIAAAPAAVVLARRNVVYRRIAAEESADRDADGVPDVYRRDADER
jgi:NhaA family Na+:H+ antiporter